MCDTFIALELADNQTQSESDNRHTVARAPSYELL